MRGSRGKYSVWQNQWWVVAQGIIVTSLGLGPITSFSNWEFLGTRNLIRTWDFGLRLANCRQKIWVWGFEINFRIDLLYSNVYSSHAYRYFGPGTVFEPNQTPGTLGLAGCCCWASPVSLPGPMALAQLWLCQPISGLQFRFCVK